MRPHLLLSFLLTASSLLAESPKASGNLIEKGELNQEKQKQGLWKIFTQSGNLIRETEYDKGKKHGLEKIYQTNGTLTSIHQFVEDKTNGKVQMFYENGKPKETYIYNNGVFDKEYKRFFPSGNLQSISTYKLGKLDGLYKEYLEHGPLHKLKVYLANHLKVERSYDVTKNILRTEKLFIFEKPEKYLLKVFNDKGVVEIEKIEIQGKKEQLYSRQNSSSGNLLKEEFFIDNFKEFELYYSPNSPDPTKALDLGL